MCSSYFFFNDTATTEIYTLSLHDALPIWGLANRSGLRLGSSIVIEPLPVVVACGLVANPSPEIRIVRVRVVVDRKSTRLNSSHANISYAVFCLKKKKKCHYHHTYKQCTGR